MDETAWLVERTYLGRPWYMYIQFGMVQWTTIAGEALRFAREADAGMAIGLLPYWVRESNDIKATEHMWVTRGGIENAPIVQ